MPQGLPGGLLEPRWAFWEVLEASGSLSETLWDLPEASWSLLAVSLSTQKIDEYIGFFGMFCSKPNFLLHSVDPPKLPLLIPYGKCPQTPAPQATPSRRPVARVWLP